MSATNGGAGSYQARQVEPDHSGRYVLLGLIGWVLWGLFVTGLAYRTYPTWYRDQWGNQDVEFIILVPSIVAWPITVVAYAGNQVLDYVDRSKSRKLVRVRSELER